MNSLEKSLFNPFFSHIYIEKGVRNHPTSKKILSRYPNAKVIEINHYKDVFNRSHQSYRLQKQSPCLILAKKHGQLIYEGAPVCQDFGNSYFYYTSLVMNCIYDCEYCYLQGMYPSANLVVFVNLEEIFEQVEKLLKEHPVYLCVSYDTDLLALEHILGYVKEWVDFAGKHPELTIEIRTKSAGISGEDIIRPLDNVILAWTLSPDKLAKAYEHYAAGFWQRLAGIQKAIEQGFPVRLCFDPILYYRDFKQQYREMIETVFLKIRSDQIKDVSLGVFRVPQDYLKKMRKQAPSSSVIQYPFDNDNGVYHYSEKLTEEMISFVLDLIKKEIPEEKIFIWEKTE